MSDEKSNDITAPYDLVALYNHLTINRLAGHGQLIRSLLPDELVSAYRRMRDAVSRRHERGKPISLSTAAIRAALAIWNSSQTTAFSLPDGQSLVLLDYRPARA